MTRYTKVNGKYLINGKKYDMLEGSRASVFHGTAYKTAGELTKSAFIMNKNGRIVSEKKHNTAKREMRLVKAGYGTQKGKFGYVRLNGTKSRSRSGSRSGSQGRKHGRKMRGGKGMNSVNSSPDVLDGSQMQVHNTSSGSQSGGRRRKHRGGNAVSSMVNNLMAKVGPQLAAVTGSAHAGAAKLH
jgi:hypothetical protein